jgi:PEP-CTERM motif
MGMGFAPHLLLAVLVCALTPSGASAALIRYSWSGFVEPGDAGNPWGLSGDGSAVTQDDGTPFTLEGFVDQAALDQDGTQNPDFAEFLPSSATLIIGGSAATLTFAEFSFSDDAFQGLFDSIGFQAMAELFSTTLQFNAAVRVPASTFDLASPAALDLPPTFAETAPVQFGGFGGDTLTYPENAPVSGVVVPEPSGLALLAAGLCALAGRRRARSRC